MTEVLTVRTDADTQRALIELTADGTSTSEAVRSAIIETAGRHARERLRQEAAELAGDPFDRDEAAQVLRDMETLSAW